MATLVLTAVGGAIGGPAGAAIGGLLGQRVDRAVLAPRGRQGPRLTDLKVQTSSYGTAIPRVFGTMRVAGCVIWSTDLIETRQDGRAGKGQPVTTSYSYAASFAVALSARPVAGVGRIWADGKLLRGAAGDWKTQTGFRLHHGSEDQAPDPLIASHEADAPAHRGIAYAVFEALQLADFGSRIPSLTFEVIGDATPPRAGDVMRALGEGAIVGAGPDDPVAGYAASGDSVAGAVAALATMTGAWMVPDGAATRIGRATGAPLVLDPDATLREARLPVEAVPAALSLSHYDPARDYQIGVQRALGTGGGWREEAIELPVALEAARARQVADDLIRERERSRRSRKAVLDATAIAIAPGTAVRSDGALWRVTRAAVEGWRVTLDLTPLGAGGALPPLPADPGRVAAARDEPIGATRIEIAELPPLDEAPVTEPRLAIFAAGEAPGWRCAAVTVSGDGGASWTAIGATAAPATLGRLAAALPAGGTAIEDRARVIELVLAHEGMTLASADAAAIDRGANLALIGDELIQFRDAVQVDATRWRLSGWWRGCRGTAATAHPGGTRFVLIERGAAISLPLPGALPGESVRIAAAGVGDGAQAAIASAAIDGRSCTPPPPVQLRAARTADGGLRLTWTRRSRLGWRWRDGDDVPLGEEREGYRIAVADQAGATIATRSSDGPQLVLSAAEVPAGAVTVAVRQQGTYALSSPAILNL